MFFTIKFGRTIFPIYQTIDQKNYKDLGRLSLDNDNKLIKNIRIEYIYK